MTITNQESATSSTSSSAAPQAVGTGSAYHLARTLVLRKRYRDAVRQLEGADRRGTLFVILAMAISATGAALAAAYESWALTALLAFILGNIATGMMLCLVHDGMHGLLWPGTHIISALSTNNVIAFSTVVARPFTPIDRECGDWDRHNGVHHKFTGTKGDPDTIESCYENTIGGVLFTEFLLKSPAARIALYAKESLYTAYDVAVSNRLAAAKMLTGKATPQREVALAAGQFAMIIAAFAAGGLHAVGFLYLMQVFNDSCCFFTASSFFNGTDHFLVSYKEPSHGVDNAMYNVLSLGFGYHAEHHDLPRIPGWKLWQLRQLAPECYPKCMYQSISTRLWNYFVAPYTPEDVALQLRFIDEMDQQACEFYDIHCGAEPRK